MKTKEVPQPALRSSSNEVLRKGTTTAPGLTENQLRDLLGIIGKKGNDFLLSRLKQNIAKMKFSTSTLSKGNEAVLEDDLRSYINPHSNQISIENSYRFFDIENKGYVTKNDFVSVIHNVNLFFSEINLINYVLDKAEIEAIYDHLNGISLCDEEANFSPRSRVNNWISKSKFIFLLSSDYINIYDIIFTKKFNTTVTITNDQYRTIHEISSSLNQLKNKIQYKQDIESNITLCTDEYVNSTGRSSFKKNSQKTLTRSSSFIKTLNKNQTNEDVDEITIGEDGDEGADFFDFGSEEGDNVYDIDNEQIHDLKVIKENKENFNKNDSHLGQKNKNKKFSFIKPFTNINNKLLLAELKKNCIDVSNSLIVLNKDDFISYIENIEETIEELITEIRKTNHSMSLKYDSSKIGKTNCINKPLKSNEQCSEDDKFLSNLLNKEFNYYLAIISCIQRCEAKIDYIYSFKIEKFLYNEVFQYNSSFFDITTGKHEKCEIFDYAPKVFSSIRLNCLNLPVKEYVLSFNQENFLFNVLVGNNYNLNEILNESCFDKEHFVFFSLDGKYIIKSISQGEFLFLHKILPSYYEHITSKNKSSFLEIILGLFTINIPEKSKKIHFIIKKNFFYTFSSIKISAKYDLKGSLYKRSSKTLPYKDLDFTSHKEKIDLNQSEKNEIYESIEKDSLFLKENNITNYSLYLGIGLLDKPPETPEPNGYISVGKDKMYFFGLVGMLTEYGGKKKMEHFVKRITQGNTISCQPPEDYMKRFNSFVRKCL